MNNSIKIFDKILDSKRLQLRRIRKEDVDDIFEYTSNPDVTKYLSWLPHKNLDQTKEFIKKTLIEYNENNNRYTWGIELKESNKLIGVISIFEISYISKRVEISYILNPNFQGSGYMNEAINCLVNFIFYEIQFIRVQAKCTTINLPSKRLLEKIGMKLEGELKSYWFLKNQYYNVLIYSKLKNKYD